MTGSEIDHGLETIAHVKVPTSEAAEIHKATLWSRCLQVETFLVSAEGAGEIDRHP